jgi:putative membrane protein insertion efficiency factor
VSEEDHPASWAARVLMLALGGYKRWVSPLLPPACRFEPTCSVYALDAVRIHGATRGLWLGLRRVLRCHPWHPGGFDPVPPARGGR